MRELIRWCQNSALRPAAPMRPTARNGGDGATSARLILVIDGADVRRAPLAAELLRRRLSPDLWRVRSAGIDATIGEPADPLIRRVAEERGVELERHRAAEAGVADIRCAALVVAMSAGQVARLVLLEPAARRRIRLLGAFTMPASKWSPGPGAIKLGAQSDIVIPTGGGISAYRECGDRLEMAVDQFAGWLDRRHAPRQPRQQRRPVEISLLQPARLG